jgi:hypothetical protein
MEHDEKEGTSIKYIWRQGTVQEGAADQLEGICPVQMTPSGMGAITMSGEKVPCRRMPPICPKESIWF